VPNKALHLIAAASRETGFQVSPAAAASERYRSASRKTSMISLEVTMPIASTWPTREELAARNAVEQALIAAPVGKCTGAGGGMGQMHLTYRVDEESSVPAARAVIDEAMKTHMPNFQYQIRVHQE
jgi:hypothetical protein